ncbi:MAG: 50S ribosomal protein L10 [Candidatus Zixiibacteriota bacterium]|nr:MAG: 50S ribosomal protein L10 [candidate division Zixibacteria bacterium]
MPREAHPTPEKIQTVQELSDLFAQAKGVYLADFTGLNVEQVNELRRNFHQQQVIYRVVKNTLIRHAAEQTGYQDLIPHLEGPTALAISVHDGVVPVRLISDFVKGKEKQIPVLKAGILEGLFVPSTDMDMIKNIPSREVLLSQILFLVQSPISGLLGTFNEILRTFLSVLEAVIEKKRAEGGAEAALASAPEAAPESAPETAPESTPEAAPESTPEAPAAAPEE